MNWAIGWINSSIDLKSKFRQLWISSGTTLSTRSSHPVRCFEVRRASQIGAARQQARTRRGDAAAEITGTPSDVLRWMPAIIYRPANVSHWSGTDHQRIHLWIVSRVGSGKTIRKGRSTYWFLLRRCRLIGISIDFFGRQLTMNRNKPKNSTLRRKRKKPHLNLY